jgi:hypothetical protein
MKRVSPARSFFSGVSIKSGLSRPLNAAFDRSQIFSKRFGKSDVYSQKTGFTGINSVSDRRLPALDLQK